MKKLIYLLSLPLIIVSCTCNTNVDAKQTSKPEPFSEVYNNEQKYNGNYTNIYKSDINANGFHYTIFNRPSSGIFVVNTTLDSLKKIELELNIEKMRL